MSNARTAEEIAAAQTAMQQRLAELNKTAAPELKPAPPVPADTTGISPDTVFKVPTNQIASRPDLMQFKVADDPVTGTNEHDRITTKYDPQQAGNLLLWEPIDPTEHGLTGTQRFIVANGHHRHLAAEDQNVAGQHAQIIREADGISAGAARSRAAEINIRGDKGTVYDAVKFIREQAATFGEDAAMERARQIGARGGQAGTIAFKAAPDLYTSFINDRVNPEQAAAIAEAAPNDGAMQRVGIRRVLDHGGKGQEIANFMQAVAERLRRAGGETAGDQGEMFGNDAAMQQVGAMADKAGEIQKKINEQINTVAGAARRPEMAGKLGVDVRDPASIKAHLTKLRALKERAATWGKDDALRDALVGDETPEEIIGRLLGEKETVAAAPAPAPNEPLKKPVTEKRRTTEAAPKKPLTEPASERATYEKQVARRGVVEKANGDSFKVLESDAQPGKYDVVATRSGKREVLSDPENPTSLKEAQELAVKHALGEVEIPAEARAALNEQRPAPLALPPNERVAVPSAKQKAADRAQAALDALGPEPPKPSPESRAFGTKGKAGADPAHVARWESETKAYNSWRAKYTKLKKAQVAASNELFQERKAEQAAVRATPTAVGQAGTIEEARAEFQRIGEETNAASRAFAKVQEDYRAGKIGDNEFLTGRALYDTAHARYDKAHTELEAAEKAEAKKPKPQLRPNENQGDIFAASADQPFNLSGETTTDAGAKAKAEAEAEAKRKADQAESDKNQMGFDLGGDEAPRAKEEPTVPPGGHATEGGKAMGAAGRKEALPSDKPIEATKAANNQRRRERGLDPIERGMSWEEEQAWNAAQDRAEADPQAAGRLVDRINAKQATGVTVNDRLDILHELVRLGNERKMEAERAQDPHATEEERAAAHQRFADAERRLDLTEQASVASGSIWGSAGRAMQMAALDDFTLEHLITRAENAQPGKPLTADERAHYEKQAAEIEKLKADAKAAKETELNDDALAALLKLIREEKKGPSAPETTLGKKSKLDALHAARDESREWLKKNLGKTTNISADPSILYHLGRIGASHIADGIVEIGKWTKKMVDEIGEGIRPILKKVRLIAEHEFETAEAEKAKVKTKAKGKGKAEGKPGSKPVSGEAKPKAEKPKVSPMEKVEKASLGGKSLTQRMVFELVREKVRDGMTELGPIMEAVKKDLEPHFPDHTVRDIRDKFSDYGKVRYPSADAVDTKVREIRRASQLVSAIEDAQRKLHPLGTGARRDKATQVIRNLTKELKATMRAQGLEGTSPEHLASQNQARATALRNEIEDLTKQIRTGEAPPAKGEPRPPTEEVVKLRAHRDRLKDELEKIESANPEIIAKRLAKDVEAKQKTLQKQVDALKAKQAAEAAGAKPEKKAKALLRPLSGDRLEALAQERDRIRQQLADARRKGRNDAALQKKLEKITDEINEKLAKLSTGDVGEAKGSARVNRPRPNDELEAAQQELDRVNKQAAEARKNSPLIDQRDLERMKKRLAEAERQYREKDYPSLRQKPRRRLTTDAVNQAAGKLALKKREINIDIKQRKRRAEDAKKSGLLAVPRALSATSRALAVGYHGTVGGLTHLGGAIFNPISKGIWRDQHGQLQGYWPSFARQFKLAWSPEYYERKVGELINDPHFLFFKKAGLANDPAETYSDYGAYGKLLEKVLGLKSGVRGFSMLKFDRQASMNEAWAKAPEWIKRDPEKALEWAQQHANQINHASGIITDQSAPWLAKGARWLDPALFAAKLEASRWARTIGDPAKTADTAYKAFRGTATEGEKSVAIKRLKAAAEFATFFGGTLAANQALLTALGSKSQINFTRPSDEDWLKHKIGGHTVAVDGGLLAPLRLIGMVVAKDILGERKQLRGQSRKAAALADVTRYFSNKVNPFANFIGEQTFGQSFSGRELPFSIPKLLGAQPPKVNPDRPPMTTAEYLISKGPIPAAGASEVIFDELRQNGMSAPDALTLMKGLGALATESIGARVQPDYAGEKHEKAEAAALARPLSDRSRGVRRVTHREERRRR